MLASQKLVRLVLWVGFTATTATCAGGCATAAVASAGTMAGLAASAVSTGADVYRLGKLDAADQVRFDDWTDDVHAAADELHLEVMTESLDNEKGEWRCTLRDERKAKINVFVQRRTETLCRTRIDVGWFGSEPTARLILARVRFQEHAAAEPAESDYGSNLISSSAGKSDVNRAAMRKIEQQLNAVGAQIERVKEETDAA